MSLAIFLRLPSSIVSPSSFKSAKLPAWIGSVRKSDLPPGCPSKGMETGKVMADPDAFGVKTAAWVEEVEATLMLAGSGAKR